MYLASFSAIPSLAGAPQARAWPGSHADGGRQSGLPGDAFIELVLRCRLGLGIKATRPGIGQAP